MELTFKEFLRSGKEQLSLAGFPEVDAEHLLAHTLGISRMDLHSPLAVENALLAIGDTTAVEETFWSLLDQRSKGYPLQYLTGVAYFRHLTLKVGPGVLVPRPESELLVEAALTYINSLDQSLNQVSVVDLGAGSGALALAIATESKRSSVIAVENSEAALPWLRENVSFIDEKVRILHADARDALIGVKCDVVIFGLRENLSSIPSKSQAP